MNQAINMLKQNDTDLLKTDQVEPFRLYLVAQKCKTRKGNGHSQLLFVATSGGWAVVQKGAGGTVKTPIALRPVIGDFLKTPLNRSMDMGKRLRHAKQVDLDNDLAQRVAVAVADPAPAVSNDNGDHLAPLCAASGVGCTGCGDSAGAGCNAGVLQSENFQILPVGALPVDPAAERQNLWAEFGKFAERVAAECKGAGPHILLSPELRKLAMKGGISISLAPAADLEHLEDLRDDFAIHCPLLPRDGEDPTAYADRRWSYADQMMASRYPQCADK